jgi:hypothetical protein
MGCGIVVPMVRRLRGWQIVVLSVIGCLVLLLGGILLLGAVLPGAGSSPSVAPTRAAVASPVPTGWSAARVVEQLAEDFSVPNVRDNSATATCRPDCLALITTDAVSVYEFADTAAAARWTREMRKVGDVRQVDRFMLSWTARSQDHTDQGTRAEMVAAVGRMLAGS